MKIIRDYSDFELPIQVFDSNGFVIKAQDTSTLDISVFTTDVSTCLVFDKDDVDASTQTIAIDGSTTAILDNGMIFYQYHLVMYDESYPDHNYTADRLCQSDIYLMNEDESHKSTCATNVSELVNDAGYITRLQAIPLITEQVDARVEYDMSTRLDNYATKSYVDGSIQSSLVGYATQQWVEDKHYVSGETFFGEIDASVIILSEETYKNIKDTSVFDASALYLTYED